MNKGGFKKGHKGFRTPESYRKASVKIGKAHKGRKQPWAKYLPQTFQKGHIMSKEIRDKISKALQGKKKSKEMRRKLSITRRKIGTPWLIGRKYPQSWRDNISESLSGEKSPRWMGGVAIYVSRHHWIHRKLGKPKKCLFCKKENIKLHWANKSGNYQKDINDWLSLCVSCHKRYDLAKIRNNH